MSSPVVDKVIIIHNRIRGMESMEKEIELIMKSRKWKVKSTKKKDEFVGLVSDAPLIRGEGG